jgi:thiamine pyrophosphate-dependent acetolactate synthase large subunit-like protein
MAADQLVRALERLGVEVVFGLPGVHNLPLWRSLAGSAVRLVGVRHEQAAVYAADGYARATGRLGVALVTTGPGAANTLGATGEAMASSSPVLVIATDIPSTLRRPGVYRGTLHETRDQAAMFEPVTKSARTVSSADSVVAAVCHAAALAERPNSGPVYVGVPTNFLSSETVQAPVPPASADGGPARVELDESEVQRACALISSSQRPLIWAGGGAVRAGAGELVGELATRLAAPVATTYMSRGLLPFDHPLLLPGSVHLPELGALWDEADAVIAIGTDFDGMTTQNWLMPQPPVLISINVDAADANKNYSSDVTLVGDAADVLRTLVSRLGPPRPLEASRKRLAQLGERVRASVLEDEPGGAALLDAFERALPPDAVVVADMCIPGYWLGGFGRFRAPRRFAYPVGWGTLGFAFPASIGSCLAGTGPTVCVSGDGGFLFSCGELATVAQEQLPLTIVLVDDGGYGMLRFDQNQAGDEQFGVDLVTPDFPALARSFGITATAVEGFGDEFESALHVCTRIPAPHMIVVSAKLKPPPTTSPRWYRRSRG